VAVASAWGLEALPGRRRRADPPVVVHLVFDDLGETVLPADSALTRSIGQVAMLLAARSVTPSG
jgi:hypothetical protein